MPGDSGQQSGPGPPPTAQRSSSILKMARPAPGSLAARSRLPFLRHRAKEVNGKRSSVGEVTIEVEVEPMPPRTPPKASPLVDYDTGPSASPSLTISPTSSPRPGTASSCSHSPHTANFHFTGADSSNNNSPGSRTSAGCKSSSSQAEDKIETDTSGPATAEACAAEKALVTTVGAASSSSGSPLLPHPSVVLRRKSPGASIPSAAGEESVANRSSSNSNSTPSTLALSTKEPLTYSRISRQLKRTSTNEVGRILKAALDAHFFQKSADQSALDEYIREVFDQLDYHHCGSISREDFETLCEVLGISASPPPSHRNSGIEWLNSYRPRPNSPLSPLKVDRLGEVKFRHPEGSRNKMPNGVQRQEQTPNFLFTFGPRPFWELWPQRKRRRRRLTIDEFKKSLLEQWAKCKGLPPSRVSTVLPVSLAKRLERVLDPDNKTDSLDNGTVANGHHPTSNGHSPPQAVLIKPSSTPTESRKKRLLRSMVRVTRRYHVLEKLSKRLQRQLSEDRSISAPTNVVSTNPQCPIHQGANGFDRVDAKLHTRTTGSSSVTPSSNVSCSSHCNGRQQPAHARHHGVQMRQRHQRIASLEQQVLHQQEEISTLREVVEDMRSSLQLSDAQNLALQVLLKKMAKAETALPSDNFRSKMNENEKQLENLVRELKEMSQIRYPTIASNVSAASSKKAGAEITTLPTTGTTSSSCSYNQDSSSSLLEEELNQTSLALGGAQVELRSTQEELQTTAVKLQQKESELQENSMNLEEAYRALEAAQKELNQMRSELEQAQAQLNTTKEELTETEEELLLTQCQLRNSDAQLRDTEKRLSQLSQNRRSLVLELQTTKELLVSSLNKVQGLELESRKVPELQHRVKELERAARDKRCSTGAPPSSSTTSSPIPTHSQHYRVPFPYPFGAHLRPLSNMDSGLYSTSTSDSDQDERANAASGSQQGEEDAPHLGLPPRPPSANSISSKPSTPLPPPPPVGILKRSGTPSSLSSTNGAKTPVIKSATPSTATGSLNTSRSSQGSVSLGNETISKLRDEIQVLKEKFVASEVHWREERSILLDEIIRRQEDFGDVSADVQVLEAQRVRLTLLEEKIKEVLHMLRSLNKMNISSKTLGKLVLDAVERSSDPLSGEVQVFKFLNQLYHSARDFERLTTENEIHSALKAVEQHSKTLEILEETGKMQGAYGKRCSGGLAAPAPHVAIIPMRRSIKFAKKEPAATVDV